MFELAGRDFFWAGQLNMNEAALAQFTPQGGALLYAITLRGSVLVRLNYILSFYRSAELFAVVLSDKGVLKEDLEHFYFNTSETYFIAMIL